MTISVPNKDKIKVFTSNDVFAVMQQVLLREQKLDQEKKHFWIIGLANNHRLLYLELVSMEV
jgi:DNA repair protein RadC